MGNALIFSAPDDTKALALGKNHLFFYNKSRKGGTDGNSLATTPVSVYDDKKMGVGIPYLYFKEETELTRSKYLIIYYHGNAELLNHTHAKLEEYHKTFRVHIHHSLLLCAYRSK